MKWRTHITLVKPIVVLLNLTIDVYNMLLVGVIAPDKLREPFSRHHGDEGKDKAIKEMWKARKYFLKGDQINAYYHLGRALHYVHDVCIGREPSRLKHEMLEYDIDITVREMMDEVVESIKQGLKNKVRDPVELENSIWSIKARRDITEIILNAAYMTGLLVSSVLNKDLCPKEYIDSYERRVKYEVISIIGAGIWLGLILELIFSFNPPIILSMILIGLTYFVFKLLRKPYEDAKKRLLWYGIKI